MKFENTIILPVILKSEPYERTWETKDPKTGATRTGSVHVIKAVQIPRDPNVEPSALDEIELNINTSKTGAAKKNLSDVVMLFARNEAKFKNGEVYANIETYMGPRRNKGVVTFFAPWINDVELVTPAEEDLPLIKAALQEDKDL